MRHRSSAPWLKHIITASRRRSHGSDQSEIHIRPRLWAASPQRRQNQKAVTSPLQLRKYAVTQTIQQGLIIKAQSGFFTVETGEGLIICQLRGKLKQGKATGDLAALGDRVRITVLEDGSGMINEVEERKQAIVRLDPRPQGEYQQILLANPDQAVFVFACAQPNPKLRMLDRYLIIAEKQRVPAIIVANKIDLIGLREAKRIFGFINRSAIM